MGSAIISIAAKNKFLTILAEHRERIKSFVSRNFRHIRSIQVTQVHIKGESSWVFVVAAKYHVLPIGCKIGSPVRPYQIGNLVCPRAICIGNPNFHIGWSHQVFGKQHISKVENTRLNVVHTTSIEDGMYPPEVDYTKMEL